MTGGKGVAVEHEDGSKESGEVSDVQQLQDSGKGEVQSKEEKSNTMVSFNNTKSSTNKSKSNDSNKDHRLSGKHSVHKTRDSPPARSQQSAKADKRTKQA